MQLYTVHAGNFKLDGGAMFGVVPKSIWHKLNPADSNNLCTWAMRCLLIEDGNQLILIDTGIGDKQSTKFLSHYHIHGPQLQQSLQALGFRAADITDVVFTHLHFDHCGGAIEQGSNGWQPAFPNARFWSNAAHWQWATEPNDREKASFLPENILPIHQTGQLQMLPVHRDGTLGNTSSLPQLNFRFAFGHTDAMLLPQIQYKGHTIVYMADLLPSIAHIPIPYVMAYDMFPLITLQEKQDFLQTALHNNYILYLEHDPIHECCTLQLTEKGIRVKDTFALSSL